MDLNPHLKGTLDILEALLKPGVTGKEVFRHFALTRSAKCALKDVSDKPPDLCFFNCKQFVLPELELLQPTVVIGQGREASWALEKAELVPDGLITRLVVSEKLADHPAQFGPTRSYPPIRATAPS